jgi:mycothiol synthase
MLSLDVTPAALQGPLMATGAAQRLVSGDSLDQAMFGAALLASVLTDARELGATRLELVADEAGTVHDDMAAAHGMALRRELLRMQCDLPLDEPWSIDVRPFEVGRDEEAWLQVNNRAFDWHPEQANLTLDALREREAEPWFDPDGFLLHERDGRLAGFCWTKVHEDERPRLGEIYVIGVDPDFHGQGLGRPLVLAGLAWLADAGLRDGLLYTEADNAPALAIYRSIGFEVVARHCWWTIDLTP